MRLNKNIIGLILGPLLFSVILIFVEADGLSFEAKCILASTAWMAVWWVTECVPISVTALLPIVLFPITGGMDLSTTTAAYGHKLVFLFVGGFLIALAIENGTFIKDLHLILTELQEVINLELYLVSCWLLLFCRCGFLIQQLQL